ncbi:hypothetical protein AMTRI_Chr04g190390 [Amborella trichopoda]
MASVRGGFSLFEKIDNGTINGSCRARSPFEISGYRKYVGVSSNLRFVRDGFCRERSKKGRGSLVAKAAGKDLNNEEGDVTEDALNATLEKSKKVLAMQKDLLQQIAERKKIVSSIKKNIGSPESEVSASTGSDMSKDSDGASTAGDSDTKYDRSGRFFNDFVQSTKTEVSKISSFIATEGTKKERVEGVSHQRSKQDEEIKETSPGTGDKSVQSKVVPQVLPQASKPYGLVKEELKEMQTVKSDVVEVAESKPEPEEKDSKPPPLAGANVMNVIVVAAECAPWVKTGGLGDVASALPRALARRGHRVMVVVPHYGDYPEAQPTGIYKWYNVAGQDMEVSYFQGYIDGVDFVFIDNYIFRDLPNNNIYGGDRLEVLKRMVLFCKAAIEVPWHVPCGGVCYGDGNLVFIANDWHTALLPVYLKAYYRDNGLMSYTRSVLVIHNVAHQGRGSVDDFHLVGLPDHYVDLFKLDDPVGGEHFNIFTAGLKTADRIVTVSHGYAWEVKTQEGGWGLHNIINENDWKLRGIVNGIDTKEWSPELDIHFKSDGYTNYSLNTLTTGKPQCKAALQRELGLPVRKDVPLIGFIGRLDHQKGVDLIAEAMPWMVSQDLQLVMLGTGRADLENMLRQFEGQYRDKVRGWVGFSVKTAHRITAGADVILMPSRFEPCGLNQLYAMRYGTIPVVHAVGGLRDTVQPFDPFNERGLGWTFDSADSGRLIHALGNCLWTYRDYKKSWEGIQRRGMMQDLSWDNAAQQYEEVLVAAKYQW